MSQSKTIFKKWAPYLLYLMFTLLLWSIIPSFSTRIENDSHAYLYFLKTFQETGSFYPPGMNMLHTWFGIGYPFFMFCCTSIFNYLEMIIIVQILLGLLSIFFIQKSALFFTDKKGAWIAALLAATNIGFIIYPHFLLTESLMLFLISFLLFLLTRINLDIIPQLFLIGLISSSTFLIKPSLIYLLPFWGVFLIYQKAKDRSWYQKIGLLFCFIGTVSIVPIGMMIYYKQRFDHCYFKSVDKVNLYYFFLPHLIAESKERPFLEIQKELNQNYPVTNYADPTSWDKINLLLKIELAKNPFLGIKIWATQMLKTLCGLYTNHLKLLLFPEIKGGDCSFFKFNGSFFERLSTYLFYGDAPVWIVFFGIFEIGMRILFIIFGIGSALHALFNKKWMIFWLLVFPCAYFLAITGADGSGRLRLLMEPFWIILIVIGIKNIENYYKRP